MPSGQVATMRCNLGQSLDQLKEHFASELKVSADIILMLFDGKYTKCLEHRKYLKMNNSQIKFLVIAH